MRCASCDHENPGRARFCLQCGAAFAQRCAACHAELPAGARFCMDCGEALEESAPAEGRARAPRDYTPQHLVEKVLRHRSALEGERKQVSVLFADVKQSVALSEGIDAEEWHAILDRFFAILAEGIHRYEGTVNQYTGDGIMALFGAPIAHEDHAQRACYAALDLTAALRSYGEEIKRTRGLSFSVRTGIHSGEVVVGKIGDDLRMDYTAQGHTVGLAARMEQLAEPSRVYLTDATARLVAGFFSLRDLGEFQLKGVGESVRVYELEGVGELRTRLDASRARGFSRFAGRGDEMARLETALERAAEGSGRVVGIVADAGVGKSRLCAEFLERCRARGVATFEAHGVSYGKSVPFLPMVELFRAYYGVSERDSPESVREKIAGRVLLLDDSYVDFLPLLFELMGVADPDQPPSSLEPEARQRRLHQLTRRIVQARGVRAPSVTLLEDLHWFDHGSDAFVSTLVEAYAGTRGLLLLNFRPEYHAPWMSKSYYEQLPLTPLGPAAIAEMLGDLLGDDPSLAGLPERVCERTQGNPFFSEEVVWDLVESGKLAGERGAYRLVGSLDDIRVPERVHSILAARIDRLPEREKQVLQTASVIGKTFRTSLLCAVAPVEDEGIQAALEALGNAELIYEHALYPEPEYTFKHPLTQDVAYGALLRERRAELHAEVARVLEQSLSDRSDEGGDESAALLAYHWDAAGEKLAAARWHSRAAVHATLDLDEARRHYGRARDLARELPASDESAGIEIGAALGILGLGWQLGGSPEEFEALLADSLALAARRSDLHAQVLLNAAAAPASGQTGDIRAYVRLAEEALELAERSRDPALETLAHCVASFARFFDGELSRALFHVDAAIRGFRDDPKAVATDIVGFTPLFYEKCFRAMVLGESGQPAEARTLMLQFEEVARESGDLPNLNQVLAALALVEAWRGDSQRSLERAREAVALAERLGSPYLEVFSHFVLGVAHADARAWRKAVDAAETALGIVRGQRVGVLFESRLVTRIARCRAELGERDRARALAEEGLAVAERCGASYISWEKVDAARVLLTCDGAAAAERVRRLLDEAQESCERGGGGLLRGELHETRARLAEVVGDDAERQRELRAAERAFAEMGAIPHAERIAQLLAEGQGER